MERFHARLSSGAAAMYRRIIQFAIQRLWIYGVGLWHFHHMEYFVYVRENHSTETLILLTLSCLKQGILC